MDIEDKRQLNEKKFTNWENLPHGGRRYYLEIKGRDGWKTGKREEGRLRILLRLARVTKLPEIKAYCLTSIFQPDCK